MAKIALYCARYSKKDITTAPLGIGYIAAYLLKKGIVNQDEIRIVDSYEELYEFNPDIIGISSVSQVINDAIQFAQKGKEDFQCLTIIGGYHITCLPDKLPEGLDIGVIGEGEETFLEIVQYFLQGKLKCNLNKIKGICYRENARIVINESREFIKDLDEIPEPYRHKNYCDEIAIITSRGCPYNCIYCASHEFWKNVVRFRSAKSVVEEIVNLVDRYKPKTINIVDDLWIADKNRFKEIVQGLEKYEITCRVNFIGFVRSNLIYEEDIILLKRMNYKFVRFGAETGSDRLLRHIKGKNISIEDHQRLIDLCYKYNLPCGASFIFGIPGERVEDIDQTIDFLNKNKDKLLISGFYFFNPIPGTIIWNVLEKDGEINKSINFEDMYIDFLNESFYWNRELYFNEKNVSFDKFKQIIKNIKREFVFSEREALVLNRKLYIYKINKNEIHKLEFGCGDQLKEGFVGVDIRKFPGVKFNCNAWEITEHVSDNSISEIYSRHFLEHLTFAQTDLTLEAWRKILIPGGIVEIIVPDILYHITQFTDERYNEISEFNSNITTLEHAVAGFWGWQRESNIGVWDIHKSGYDFRSLKKKLIEHGFCDIERIEDKPWNLHIICKNNRNIQLQDMEFDIESNDFDQMRPVVIFGASKFGEKIYQMLNHSNIKVDFFCDNDQKKWNNFLYGIKIISPKELNNMGNDTNVLIASIYFKEIYSQLIELGFNNIYYLKEQYNLNKADECIQDSLNSGERQVASTLDGIRPDHLARYELATIFCEEKFKVLDMACGIGYGSYLLATKTKCEEIMSVDINEHAIEYGKKHYKSSKIKYYAEDCLKIKLNSNSYDLVTCYETIEHIQDDKKLLLKIYDALKDNGTLLISTPNQIELPFCNKNFPFHLRHYTPENLKNLLKETGFIIKGVYSQRERESRAIISGWEGKYNIVICKKQ